jgi:hypothetical protein
MKALGHTELRDPGAEDLDRAALWPAKRLLVTRSKPSAKRALPAENFAEFVARLTVWRANDAAFLAVAKGRGELESALPVSADIAELADVALAAIEAREAGKALDPSTKARAKTVLDRVEAFEAASAKPLLAFVGKQPPADLIV